MIAKLEESQKNAERDWNEAEALRKQSEKLHRELQRQIIEFNDERDEKLLKAQKEGEEKVEAAKKEAEGIIQELRQLRKAQLVNVKDHELIGSEEPSRRNSARACEETKSKREKTLRRNNSYAQVMK